MAAFNLQSALAALQDAPPEVKRKASEMIAQAGGLPQPQEQGGTLQSIQSPASNDQQANNPTFGNVSDILANYNAIQNPLITAAQTPGTGMVATPSMVPDQTPTIASQPFLSPQQPDQTTNPSGLPSFPGAAPASFPSFNAPTTTPQPRFIQPAQASSPPVTLADQVADAENKYRAAILAPKPKAKWWQNALAVGGAVASNILNPKNQVPIRSWSQIQHDNAVKDAAETLQPLAALQTGATNDAYKRAQTDWMLGRNPTSIANNQATNANRLAVAQERAQATLNNINKRAEVLSGLAKPVVNAQGQMELEYLHADPKTGQHRPNELLLGADGQPVTVPGEEGVQWKDPLTGNVTTLKAKQASASDATVAAGNARLEQQGTEFNATQQRLIDDANSKLKNDWMNRNAKTKSDWQLRNANRAIEIAKATAGIPELEGPNAEVQAAVGKMQALYNMGEKGQQSQEFQKAQEDLAKAYKNFMDNASKNAGGQKVVQAIQSAMEREPEYEKEPEYIKMPTTVTPAKVGGGVTGTSGGRYAGQVFATPQSLQQYFPGKSPAEIKATVEGQGGRFQ